MELAQVFINIAVACSCTMKIFMITMSKGLPLMFFGLPYPVSVELRNTCESLKELKKVVDTPGYSPSSQDTSHLPKVPLSVYLFCFIKQITLFCNDLFHSSFVNFSLDTMPTRRRHLKWTPDIHWSKSSSREWRLTKKTKLLKILPVYSLKLLPWDQGTWSRWAWLDNYRASNWLSVFYSHGLRRNPPRLWVLVGQNYEQL